MGVDGVSKVVDRHHCERTDANYSRIVDENVDRTEFLADLINRRVRLFPHRDIGFNCKYLLTKAFQVSNCAIQGFRISSRNSDFCSPVRKFACEQ